MPEHIDYLRKLSRVEQEARHNDRPSFFKAKQLLNEENILPLSLSKKALHIYNQKCHWKYTLRVFKFGILVTRITWQNNWSSSGKIPTSALVNGVSASKRKGYQEKSWELQMESAVFWVINSRPSKTDILWSVTNYSLKLINIRLFKQKLTWYLSQK